MTAAANTRAAQQWSQGTWRSKTKDNNNNPVLIFKKQKTQKLKQVLLSKINISCRQNTNAVTRKVNQFIASNDTNTKYSLAWRSTNH